MSTLTIHITDDELSRRLFELAQSRGLSLEKLVNVELDRVAAANVDDPHARLPLGQRIRARFADIGDFDLTIPPRDDMPRLVDFG